MTLTIDINLEQNGYTGNNQFYRVLNGIIPVLTNHNRPTKIRKILESIKQHYRQDSRNVNHIVLTGIWEYHSLYSTNILAFDSYFIIGAGTTHKEYLYIKFADETYSDIITITPLKILADK